MQKRVAKPMCKLETNNVPRFCGYQTNKIFSEINGSQSEFDRDRSFDKVAPGVRRHPLNFKTFQNELSESSPKSNCRKHVYTGKKLILELFQKSSFRFI